VFDLELTPSDKLLKREVNSIVPFCTHEGSGLGHSERDIKKLCPEATVLKG
jgi:hypothetical protein